MITKRSAGRSAAAGLTLGALGVVFGDIGTSPLYALQAIFGPVGLHLAITPANVYGVISLVIWAVILVVSVKYIGFIMRANNKGEGGIMALVTLIKHDKTVLQHKWLFIFIGLAGVALFYGNSAITPAISVLSAVEGLKLVSAGFTPWILPITIALLVLLFWIQKYGTTVIGRVFGPVMFVWFATIGLAGGWRTLQHPEALQALSPLAALQFFAGQPLLAFVALGAVILAVTGAEALYADMGHFGRKPIARAWFLIVFPALVLCYIGQGSLLLNEPLNGATPFMALFPDTLRIPAILLATVATLIASQAVISGAFSMTRQAIQLNFLPRMRVVHTSARTAGQIYLPFINLMLFFMVILLVVLFGSSASLASAYGLAVSGTLITNTILFLVVARIIWHKSSRYIWTAGIVFLGIELAFVAANLAKIMHGGWFPVLLGAVAFVAIYTWLKGQRIVTAERQELEGPLQDYIGTIRHAKPPIARLPGNAIYIGHHAHFAPLALHTAVEQLHELHQKVVIVSVHIANAAHVPESKRAVFDELDNQNDGISHLVLHYGYHDVPNVPHSLRRLRGISPELDFDTDNASYFVSLSKVVPSRRHNMAGWQKNLYCMMSRNALSASDYYKLPVERTVEMRSLIEL